MQFLIARICVPKHIIKLDCGHIQSDISFVDYASSLTIETWAKSYHQISILVIFSASCLPHSLDCLCEWGNPIVDHRRIRQALISAMSGQSSSSLTIYLPIAHTLETVQIRLGGYEKAILSLRVAHMLLRLFSHKEAHEASLPLDFIFMQHAVFIRTHLCMIIDGT